ncbi:hypothetical protein [Lacinutrix sp. MedPE-SW]|uniref:hypothetical protein n=1 Tax=Lacinutrix sp. MedPE-SW TaxID=1860087 RepID=UPI00091A0EC8|nr:hypothetical protein [Lacinutrix sp. MedPE-SW]OIQ19477.1 MAG: hypothetical protein BM549_11085 [Lacinutrix sp. MedPE-SW]
MKQIRISLFLILIVFKINAQEHNNIIETHNEGNGFRIAGIIGHTLINNEGAKNVFVPSWGLDFEYWFNHNWGIGLHNDIEIETFIIRNSNSEAVERVNPLVLTLDVLHQFGNGFVLTIGPGVELEKEESYWLLRFGIEYEKDISESFYLLPTLFLDKRFDGYNTWNFGLGVGLKL